MRLNAGAFPGHADERYFGGIVAGARPSQAAISTRAAPVVSFPTQLSGFGFQTGIPAFAIHAAPPNRPGSRSSSIRSPG